MVNGPMDYNKLPKPLKLKHSEDMAWTLFCAVGNALRVTGYIKNSKTGEKKFGRFVFHDWQKELLPVWEGICSERTDLLEKFYEQLGKEDETESGMV